MTDVTAGSMVGGCRIEDVIGRGGMGVVYRATQVAFDRQVAVKLIAPEYAADPEFRARFQQEWRAAGGLDHPNIVPLHQAGEDDGKLYVVMRYVQGTDLRELIDRRGAVDPQRAVGIVRQVAEALDEAHGHGLIHRDVKPANILIATASQGRDRVYLTDFGLTKHATSAVARMTNTGQWVGTPDYIAPEQVEGRTVDARADVYALGCVLYEALTGSLPFPQEELVAKVVARMQQDPPPVSTQRPNLAAFDPVLLRGMARDPAARFQTAGELAAGAEDAVRLSAGATEAGRTVGDDRSTRVVPGAPPTAPPGPPTPPAPGGYPAPAPGGYPAPAPGGYPAPAPGAGVRPPYTPAPPGGPVSPPPFSGRPPRRPAWRHPLAIAAYVLVPVLLVGGVAAAVLLSGGGSGDGPSVDPARAQADVERFVTDRLELDSEASCPSDVRAESGTTFTCIAKTAPLDRIEVRATVRDEQGSTTQRLGKIVYDSTYIEENAKEFFDKQRDRDRIDYTIAETTCPPTFVAVPGRKFTCPVRFDDGVREAFPVTVTSAVEGRYTIGYRKANGDLR